MQQMPRNLWIPLLIAFIIGCGLFGSMVFPPIMVWGVITVGMFGAILLGQPRRILFLIWLWAAFQPLISQISNNSAIRYMDELFVVASIMICAGIYIWRKVKNHELAGLIKITLAVLGVVVISFLVNRSPIPNAANFVLGYLPFPFVFYAAYAVLDRRHWRYLFWSMIGLMLVQFVLNIGWRLGVNPLPNVAVYRQSAEDFAQGTFASCATVAYFMGVMIFMLFSALRLGSKTRKWVVLFFGVAVLQLYITYTNHAYLFFIVLAPVYLIVSKQSMRIRLAAVGAVLLVWSAFSFLAAWDTKAGYTTVSVDRMLDKQNLEYRWTRFVHGPKIELINRIAIQNASKDPLLWLFGNGPGYGLSAIGMERGSPFAWEYLGQYVANTDSFRAGDMTSISGSFYSGILSLWSELGALGYLSYVGMYLYAIQRVIRRLLKNKYKDPLQRVLAEGFVMAILMYMLSSLLFDVFWMKYFSIGLWIWAAMVWDPVEEGETTEDRGRSTEDGSQEPAGGERALGKDDALIAAIKGRTPVSRGLTPRRRTLDGRLKTGG